MPDPLIVFGDRQYFLSKTWGNQGRARFTERTDASRQSGVGSRGVHPDDEAASMFGKLFVISFMT